jgi:hypothetical protein
VICSAGFAFVIGLASPPRADEVWGQEGDPTASSSRVPHTALIQTSVNLL